MTIIATTIVALFVIAFLISHCDSFISSSKMNSQLHSKSINSLHQRNIISFQTGKLLITNRLKPLRDILGLGAPEIGIALVVALVLFGPETLKSLSKDLGKAAAELKEIPKTFKEGMDEGAESVQVSKMKAIAAEKRKLRDEKLAAKSKEGGDSDDEDDVALEK